MSDEQKKPKDIKDLKARLGRGQPSMAPPGASMPPPGGGVAPPPVIMPPSLAPKGGVGMPGAGAGVAPPPFGQTAPAQERKSLDPFAAGAAPAAGPREVRIVVDDKAIDHAEIGRATNKRNAIVIGIGLVLGLSLGYILGIGMNDRRIQNSALHDARDLATTIRNAEPILADADRLIRQAFEKASPQPGTAPQVDFDAITALRALRKPFTPEMFYSKKYSAFGSETVDNIFHLNNNVQVIWQRIEALAARSLSGSARTELTNAVRSAGELSTTQYGLIPRQIESAFVGSLVFVDKPEPPAEGAPPRTDATVRDRRGGAAVTKTIFNGQELAEEPSNYVILIDTASSVQVLGQSASSFADYRQRLAELKQLVDDTREVRGRLERSLGQIATATDVFAL